MLHAAAPACRKSNCSQAEQTRCTRFRNGIEAEDDPIAPGQAGSRNGASVGGDLRAAVGNVRASRKGEENVNDPQAENTAR